MFGTNPIAKRVINAGDRLRIVRGSPFLTVQGEGPYAGHAAVFIRLHGCHLRCWFCDTNFSDSTDPLLYVKDIVERVMVMRGAARLVVITGGEPFVQSILPLCIELNNLGFTVQIETAGSFWIEGIQNVAQVVCSPKTPTIHDEVYNYATAFKYVIDAENQEFGSSYIPIASTQRGTRAAQLAAPRSGAPVYLSPCDVGDEKKNAANRELVARLAIQYGVIAGLQLHKFFRVD